MPAQRVGVRTRTPISIGVRSHTPFREGSVGVCVRRGVECDYHSPRASSSHLSSQTIRPGTPDSRASSQEAICKRNPEPPFKAKSPFEAAPTPRCFEEITFHTLPSRESTPADLEETNRGTRQSCSSSTSQHSSGQQSPHSLRNAPTPPGNHSPSQDDHSEPVGKASLPTDRNKSDAPEESSMPTGREGSESVVSTHREASEEWSISIHCDSGMGRSTGAGPDLTQEFSKDDQSEGEQEEPYNQSDVCHIGSQPNPDSTQDLVPDESQREMSRSQSSSHQHRDRGRKRKSEPPSQWPDPSELSWAQIEAYLDHYNLVHNGGTQIARLVGSYNLLRSTLSKDDEQQPSKQPNARASPAPRLPTINHWWRPLISHRLHLSVFILHVQPVRPKESPALLSNMADRKEPKIRARLKPREELKRLKKTRRRGRPSLTRNHDEGDSINFVPVLPKSSKKRPLADPPPKSARAKKTCPGPDDPSPSDLHTRPQASTSRRGRQQTSRRNSYNVHPSFHDNEEEEPWFVPPHENDRSNPGAPKKRKQHEAAHDSDALRPPGPKQTWAVAADPSASLNWQKSRPARGRQGSTERQRQSSYSVHPSLHDEDELARHEPHAPSRSRRLIPHKLTLHLVLRVRRRSTIQMHIRLLLQGPKESNQTIFLRAPNVQMENNEEALRLALSLLMRKFTGEDTEITEFNATAW
ncbi:uncharacterized protein PGTG_22606 [Puccinia graminis f. sp. tritici CRL 75-36-700-3]|uniref:Uncharacterized protein n=1 Tax=Puccinia graminis f. sp. tritici (strain CRL 75-36-700-3 / race SCCL) TaxID=418459 RepID=H6QV18_PUCGT|nr:uncharacterized protein PGTG_22606 [Puccinia graminis f. sp. tritici CRL 75-36-700-3]EHS62631.1 hypothetical protein PGTG_22606 [Puccinia graminis f. sp. tritici CRL 75-36-700-3]